MDMIVKKVTTTKKTSGTYRNIYCEIVEHTASDKKGKSIKWTAGFRGTGFTNTYYEAEQCIKDCIDKSKEK